MPSGMPRRGGCGIAVRSSVSRTRCVENACKNRSGTGVSGCSNPWVPSRGARMCSLRRSSGDMRPDKVPVPATIP